MTFKKLFFNYWLPVFVWAGLIFSLSHMPADELPSWDIPNLDKGVHAFEFAVLAYLLIRSISVSYPGAPRVFLLLFTGLFGVGYAVLDEWHQSFVPGRTPDLLDLLADSVGIGLILLLKSRY